MHPTVTVVDRIDQAIAAAYIRLGAARTVRARCPSAANDQAVTDALTAVDALLDRRLTTT